MNEQGVEYLTAKSECISPGPVQSLQNSWVSLVCCTRDFGIPYNE